MSDEREWVTAEDVAEYLAVAVGTVRRWIRNGELPALDLGHRAGYRIRQSDLDQFIAERYGPGGKLAA